MEQKILHIPSDSFALETELTQKKSKYMEQIYKSFETHYIDNKIVKKKLKVFQFRGTNLIVILKHAHYVTNLKNLLDYYIIDEQYEKCKLINNIINYINNKDSNIDQDST
jgi:flagellar biosynthesis regulator FlbT